MNWIFLKHKKIRLIKDLDSLNNSQYIEFATGDFNNKYWRESSVFVEDEIFLLIEQPFSEINSEITDNEISQITVQNWRTIYANLKKLKISLKNANSASDIAFILTYVSEEIKKSFIENFNEARNETVKLIKDLSEWIKLNLEKYKTISIISV